MKKRLFALLVATLIVLSVAIPIGAEESTRYRLVGEGTKLTTEITGWVAISVDGIDNDYVNIDTHEGPIVYKYYVDGVKLEKTVAQLRLVETTDNARTYEIYDVDPAFRITVTDTEFSYFSAIQREWILQILIPAGAEPEETDPEPEETDPEPEETDPEPEETDPEPEETDPEPEVSVDGITEATANTLLFWEEFWEKIFTYIAHPSYALYDINSPAFTVLVLVFAGGFLLLVLDFIKQFFTNFRR